MGVVGQPPGAVIPYHRGRCFVQFGARAAVGGRIGRQRRRDSAEACGVRQQGTVRLDPDVLAKFREGGSGWQGRINAALRAAAGLQG